MNWSLCRSRCDFLSVASDILLSDAADISFKWLHVSALYKFTKFYFSHFPNQRIEMTHVWLLSIAIECIWSIAIRRWLAHVQKFATLKLQNMRKRRFDDRFGYAMKAATSTVRQTNIHSSRRLLILLQRMKRKIRIWLTNF